MTETLLPGHLVLGNRELYLCRAFLHQSKDAKPKIWPEALEWLGKKEKTIILEIDPPSDDISNPPKVVL